MSKEYKILNPQTLEEDVNGERYSVETIGSAVMISVCPLIDEIEPILIEPKPTIEEQLTQLKADNQALKNDNLILMDVLATMYEDMLAKGTV